MIIRIKHKILNVGMMFELHESIYVKNPARMGRDYEMAVAGAMKKMGVTRIEDLLITVTKKK